MLVLVHVQYDSVHNKCFIVELYSSVPYYLKLRKAAVKKWKRLGFVERPDLSRSDYSKKRKYILKLIRQQLTEF